MVAPYGGGAVIKNGRSKPLPYSRKRFFGYAQNDNLTKLKTGKRPFFVSVKFV